MVLWNADCTRGAARESDRIRRSHRRHRHRRRPGWRSDLRAHGRSGSGRPPRTQPGTARRNRRSGRVPGWMGRRRPDRGRGGPGTFTGLRIAVSTASGLAMSTGIPATGVSTPGGDGPLDGRRNRRGRTRARRQTRRSLHRRLGRGRDRTRYRRRRTAPGEAIASIGSIDGPVRVAGPGAVRFRNLFADAGIRVEDPESEHGRLSGVAICELGESSRDPVPDQPLQPIYIREPDAKLWLERDRRTAPG